VLAQQEAVLEILLIALSPTGVCAS
jgi:hypothetical protein